MGHAAKPDQNELDGSSSDADAGTHTGEAGPAPAVDSGPDSAQADAPQLPDAGLDAGNAADASADAQAPMDADTGAMRADAGEGDAGASAQQDAFACVPGAIGVVDSPATDMLLVLDRSGSMGQSGNWAVAAAGLKSACSSHDDATRFGLALFPGEAAPPPPQQDCSLITDLSQQLACEAANASSGFSNSAVCETGQIAVPIAAQSSDAIAAALDTTVASGGTPTAATLEAAGASLVASAAARARPAAVVLITDGVPNCVAGTIGGSNAQAVTDTTAAIQALLTQGIRTYVLGFDGGDAAVSAALDQFAQAGGTGATAHQSVSNATNVAAAVESTLGPESCTFILERAVEGTQLRLTLDGVPVSLDFTDGFTVHAGTTLRLHGKACNFFESAGQHTLDAQVVCN